MRYGTWESNSTVMFRFTSGHCSTRILLNLRKLGLKWEQKNTLDDVHAAIIVFESLGSTQFYVLEHLFRVVVYQYREEPVCRASPFCATSAATVAFGSYKTFVDVPDATFDHKITCQFAEDAQQEGGTCSFYTACNWSIVLSSHSAWNMC